jgi:hypothetical protein
MIAFSRGKDSIGTSVGLLDAGFDLCPFAMIGVPNLSFIEESLAYYETKLFGGKHIIRTLYPHFAKIVTEGAYHYPDWLPVGDAAALYFDVGDITEAIARHEGLSPLTYTAIGVRAADNMLRRKIIAVNGPVIKSKRQFYAIWDWTVDTLTERIVRFGVKLPPDYRIWSHSFFELTSEYIIGVKKHYPDDYKKILEWFPLAEAEVFRYEKML